MIPNPANPQAFNRFSYVYNRPINFNDPSGHDAWWCTTASCQAGYYENKTQQNVIFREDAGQEWTDAERNVINTGANDIALALASQINQNNLHLLSLGILDYYEPVTPDEAFNQTFGGPIVARRSAEECRCWAEHRGRVDGEHFEIWFYSTTSPTDITSHPNLFVHEVGHAFDASIGLDATSVIPANLLRPFDSDGIVGMEADGLHYYGYYGPHYSWQFGRSANNRQGEEFADMFVAWVYGRWEESATGVAKRNFMNSLMISYTSP